MRARPFSSAFPQLTTYISALLILACSKSYAEFNIPACEKNAAVDIRLIEPAIELEQHLKREVLQSIQITETLSLICQLNKQTDKTLSIVFGPLPENIKSASPVYKPAHKQIHVPYRYIYQTKKLLNRRKHIHQSANTPQMVLDTLAFLILHEYAHAFFHLNQTPILGKEEDAADNIASVLAIKELKSGSRIVRNMAELFKLWAIQDGNNIEYALNSEHSLSMQRYYSLKCIAYGHSLNNNQKPIVEPVIAKTGANPTWEKNYNAKRKQNCSRMATKLDRSINELIYQNNAFR